MTELTKRSRAIRERAEKGATIGELARGANPNMVQVISAHDEQPYLLDIADAADVLARHARHTENCHTLWKYPDGSCGCGLEHLIAELTRYREWQDKQDG